MKKKKKRIIAGIIILAAVAVAACAFFLRGKSSGNNGNTAYVQKVSSVQYGSSSSFAQRFSGVAESQASADIKADSSKKIAEIYVSEGDSVKKDDPLFKYDASEAQKNIDSANLDIEGSNNDIQACNNDIADLNAERAGADSAAGLQITSQIQDKQMQIRQDQLDIQSKQNDIAGYQKEIDQAVVKASIDGIVKSVNTNGGTDPNTGAELPVVSIAQTGELRIRGTVSEQNVSQIAAGMKVTVRSRVDESKTWSGTVVSVDTEPQTSDSSSYYSSESSGESASKYDFFVSLDQSDGLLLGQHVFVEPGTSGPKKEGIWLDQSFVVQDEDGTSYVWKNNKGKLAKQTVETGKQDDETYTVQIKSGLSEDDEIAYPDSSYTEGMKAVSAEADS